VVSTPVREVAIEERLVPGVFLERLPDRREHGVANEREDFAVARRVLGALIGDGVPVMRAIGRVRVDDDRRVPSVHEPDEGPGFGCFKFDVVAVEVESLRVFALPHFIGPVLTRAVVGAEAFVPVGVVDRDYAHNEVLEQGLILGQGKLTSEHGQGFLATDLARVNVAEEEDHGSALDILRLFNRRVGNDGQRNVPAFVRSPDRVEPNPVRLLGQRAEKGADLVIGHGSREVGELGGRHRGRRPDRRRCVLTERTRGGKDGKSNECAHNVHHDPFIGQSPPTTGI